MSPEAEMEITAMVEESKEGNCFVLVYLFDICLNLFETFVSNMCWIAAKSAKVLLRRTLIYLCCFANYSKLKRRNMLSQVIHTHTFKNHCPRTMSHYH